MQKAKIVGRIPIRELRERTRHHQKEFKCNVGVAFKKALKAKEAKK